MEDHHVDRPDVDARQRVQLTGPNRSQGLTNPQNARRAYGQTQPTHTKTPIRSAQTNTAKHHETTDENRIGTSTTHRLCLEDLVAMARVKHPIPSRTRP